MANTTCGCRPPKKHIDCAYCGIGGPCTHICGVCKEAGIDGQVIRGTERRVCQLHKRDNKTTMYALFTEGGQVFCKDHAWRWPEDEKTDPFVFTHMTSATLYAIRHISKACTARPIIAPQEEVTSKN